MGNIKFNASKKTTIILLVVLFFVIGGSGGYLLWRVNQKDTVAPTDSSASECVACLRDGNPIPCTSCQTNYELIDGKCCKVGSRPPDGGDCIPFGDPAYGCHRCTTSTPYKCGDYYFNTEPCNQKYCKDWKWYYYGGDHGTVNGQDKVEAYAFYGDDGPVVTAAPKPGYKFTGWSDGKSDNPRQEKNVISRPPNAGYTANFEELAPVVEEFVTVTYTVNDSNGGEIVGSKTQKIKKGTGSGTQVTAKAKSGYDFTKWSDDNPSSIRTDKNLDKDTTFTAIFTPTRSDAKLRLEYIAGPGGSIMGTKVQTVSKGGNGTPVTAIADNGYVFDGWCEDVSMTVCVMAADSGPGGQPGTGGATRVDSNVQANATYTARFKVTSPTDPVNCTGFKLSCGSNNTINVNWNLVPGSIKYIARVNKAPKGDWLNKEAGDIWESVGSNVNSYVIKNVEPGVAYGVNIMAYSGPDGEKDFHPSCNVRSLGQIWDPPLYYEIACQGTTPIYIPTETVPDTAIFDDTKDTIIFGIVVLMVGLGWTWVSTLPKRAYSSISKASTEFVSNINETKEKNTRENRRNRLERRIK